MTIYRGSLEMPHAEVLRLEKSCRLLLEQVVRFGEFNRLRENPRRHCCDMLPSSIVIFMITYDRGHHIPFLQESTDNSIPLSPYQTLIAAECMSNISWKTEIARKRREGQRREVYEWSQDHQKNNIRFNRKRGGKIKYHHEPAAQSPSQLLRQESQHGQFQDPRHLSKWETQNCYFVFFLMAKLMINHGCWMNFWGSRAPQHLHPFNIPPGVPRRWDLRHVLDDHAGYPKLLVIAGFHWVGLEYVEYVELDWYINCICMCTHYSYSYYHYYYYCYYYCYCYYYIIYMHTWIDDT